MDIALALARELGPNRSDRILVDPEQEQRPPRGGAHRPAPPGRDPPMSFRRGAIVPMKTGRLHLVHTANGRAIAERVEIPDTSGTDTTNPWQPAAGQSYFLTTGEQ